MPEATIAMPQEPSAAVAIAAIASATDRLLATVDRMSAADFAAPSVLPGWSRAHVLAHVALNAKGLAGALTKHGTPDPLPMYASNERRDGDIDDLAAQEPAVIADRLAIGSALIASCFGGGPAPEDALEAVGGVRGSGDRTTRDGAAASDADLGDGPHRTVFARAADEASETIAGWSAEGTIERTPGGPRMPAGQFPFMRWREVEIHHADLGLGFGPADWSPLFADYLFEVAAYDRDPELALTLRAAGRADLVLGAGGDAGPTELVVSGSVPDLTWWLIGRGHGEGLTCDGGPLPELGPWKRR